MRKLYMLKVSLDERISRYLENYNENNNLQYIPIHPEDYEFLLNNNKLSDYSLPFVKLGDIFEYTHS